MRHPWQAQNFTGIKGSGGWFCVQSYGLQTLPSTEELNVPIQESLYSKHNY